jgi:hypothetical protein
MVTTGSLVSSATAIRVAAGCAELVLDRTPHLAQLAVAASLGGSARAQAAFRDDLMALARETAERSYREVRCGLDKLDKSTRPGPQPGARPHRPYRYKL